MSVNKIKLEQWEVKIPGVPEGWELVRIDEAKKHEFYLDGCGEPRACRWDRETTLGCAIVRKIEPPKPTYIPWDFDTMPDCVRVKSKEDATRFMARPISDSSCLVKTQSSSYEYLFEHYTQLDGTPCGTPCGTLEAQVVVMTLERYKQLTESETK